MYRFVKRIILYGLTKPLPVLFTIRSQYINEFIELCPSITKYISDERVLLLSLLDPFSPLVPADVRDSWKDSDKVYKTSRNFFYDLHKKREKIIEKKETDKTNIIVTLSYN